jgi:DNA-binding transcriptional MocR family regulator
MHILFRERQSMMTTLEKAARAICAKRCVRAQFLDEPCIDPETGRNAPCRANEAQLTLTAGIWDGAQAALAIFSAALLDPSDEVVNTADREFWATEGPTCVRMRAALRAAGVKITGKD